MSVGTELTVTVLDMLLNTSGVDVPVSVAMTLKVWDPTAGMFAPNVTVPVKPAASVTVFTTVLVPVLIRLYVKGPVPPLLATL